MSEQSAFSRKAACLVIITGCTVLLAGSLLLAHGEAEHEAEPGTDTMAVAPAISPTAGLDLAYQEIAAGFGQLEPIFRKGCFDCHSEQTVYPWYHKLPLVSGLIDSDIKEAREHLDMSSGFPFRSHASPADDLAEIKAELEDGGMPPILYRLMHWSAKPSETEQDSVFQWVDHSLKLLAAHGQTPRGSGEESDD